MKAGSAGHGRVYWLHPTAAASHEKHCSQLSAVRAIWDRAAGDPGLIGGHASLCSALGQKIRLRRTDHCLPKRWRRIYDLPPTINHQPSTSYALVLQHALCACTCTKYVKTRLAQNRTPAQPFVHAVHPLLVGSFIRGRVTTIQR